MDTLAPEELNEVAGILSQILANDNTTRKGAEEKLSNAKLASPDKYCLLLCSMFHPSSHQVQLEVKQLASVILRRNISIESIDTQDLNNLSNNDNLWQRLSDEARAQTQTLVLETLNGIDTGFPTSFIHKICQLAVEIQGAMQEHQDKFIW